MSALRRLVRRLRDRRGSSAVEFALLAPTLILLICGGIELGHFYLAWMTLEGATLEAARTAATTQETDAATRESTMRTSITQMMSAFPIQAGQALSIQIKSYANFTNAGTPEPFTDKNGNGVWDASIYKDTTEGGTGDVISYTSTFPAAYYFTFLQAWGMKGVTLHTTVVTRNEPVATNSGT